MAVLSACAEGVHDRIPKSCAEPKSIVADSNVPEVLYTGEDENHSSAPTSYAAPLGRNAAPSISPLNVADKSAPASLAAEPSIMCKSIKSDAVETNRTDEAATFVCEPVPAGAVASEEILLEEAASKVPEKSAVVLLTEILFLAVGVPLLMENPVSLSYNVLLYKILLLVPFIALPAKPYTMLLYA